MVILICLNFWVFCYFNEQDVSLPFQSVYWLPRSIYSIRSIVTQTKPWCRIARWKMKYTTNNSIGSVNIKITLQTGSPDHPEINKEDNLLKGTLLGRPCTCATDLLSLWAISRTDLLENKGELAPACPRELYAWIC